MSIPRTIAAALGLASFLALAYIVWHDLDRRDTIARAEARVAAHENAIKEIEEWTDLYELGQLTEEAQESLEEARRALSAAKARRAFFLD